MGMGSGTFPRTSSGTRNPAMTILELRVLDPEPSRGTKMEPRSLKMRTTKTPPTTTSSSSIEVQTLSRCSRYMENPHPIDLKLRDEFMKILEGATQLRKDRPEEIKAPSFSIDKTEPAWVSYERQVMHEAVNAARSKRGKGSAPLYLIYKAERKALGRIDYASKFSLYCTEIVQSCLNGWTRYKSGYLREDGAFLEPDRGTWDVYNAAGQYLYRFAGTAKEAMASFDSKHPST